MNVAELIFALLKHDPEHEVVIVVDSGPFGAATVSAKVDPAQIWNNSSQLILRGTKTEEEEE